ncbi:MAG: tRNA pseudouridine(54/55) synthase Pus10 [archaeon]|nr:tRNA pseudouridine(54/55) synthase Pus10 [archaeon]
MEEWISKIANKAKELANINLCDHCLGRMFGKVGTGMTNDIRGMKIRVTLEEIFVSTANKPDEPCILCKGIFNELNRYADAIVETISAVESKNFLVGSRVDPEIIKKEKDIQEKFQLKQCESIKSEINREVGKLVLSAINRPVEFKSPQVVACVDTRFASVTLDIAPIFIHGYYNKLSREIPQTIWPCRICHGKGCGRCHGTGKMYQTSVQEEIGNIALRMFNGENHFFHGMGREDIDALCLGKGRPFVLEISNPRIREIDLNDLEIQANTSKVAQFHCLQFVDKDTVRKVKMATPTKVYKLRVRANSKVNKEAIDEAISSLSNVCVSQRTPKRVEHRRADLVRSKMIHWIEVGKVEDCTFDIALEAESGTYVKEFISGDGGRTKPNFSDALGVQCTVEALDVVAINEEIK